MGKSTAKVLEELGPRRETGSQDDPLEVRAKVFN